MRTEPLVSEVRWFSGSGGMQHLEGIFIFLESLRSFIPQPNTAKGGTEPLRPMSLLNQTDP